MNKRLYLFRTPVVFYGLTELFENDFEVMGCNTTYTNDYYTNDTKAYLTNDGNVIEVCGKHITGIWDKDVFKAITWE